MEDIPTIVLSAIISALSFAFIGIHINLRAQILVGFLGLTQVILAVLHTWFRYSELAEKHREVGSNYAAIRRQIEELRIIPLAISEELLNEVRAKIDDISIKVPVIPERIWKKLKLLAKIMVLLMKNFSVLTKMIFNKYTH